MQHQINHVGLAFLCKSRRTRIEADRGEVRGRVNLGKPAEADHAEQQVGRLAGSLMVESELGYDRGERYLTGRESSLRIPRSISQRLALHEPDEVRSVREKVEIVPNYTRQNHFGRFLAAHGVVTAFDDRIAGLTEASLQHRPPELAFGAEEVTRCAARDAGVLADLGHAGGVVSPLREQLLSGVEDGLPASGRIALMGRTQAGGRRG